MAYPKRTGMSARDSRYRRVGRGCCFCKSHRRELEWYIQEERRVVAKCSDLMRYGFTLPQALEGIREDVERLQSFKPFRQSKDSRTVEYLAWLLSELGDT